MDNDQLGKKGENRFGEWCSDIGLTCNRSDWDRAGWDFLVDFPHEASTESLDKRKGPRACVIQTKTVLSSTKRVKVRLDMAERLAKDVKPAFIVVLVVHGLDITHAHVLHIRGKHLEHILKRLRKAQFDGKADDLGGIFVTFPLSSAERIGANGAALRKALEDVCPHGMDAYAASKRVERDTVGYPDSPFKGTFVISKGNSADMLDLFLGRKRNMPVHLSGITETRFGLTLPHLESGPAFLTIDPAPDAEGTVRMTSERLDGEFTGRGQVFMPNVTVGGYRKLEWRTPGLDVTVLFHPEKDLEFNFTWRWIEEDATIDGWARQTRALSMLQLPDTVIVLSVLHPAVTEREFLRINNVPQFVDGDELNNTWLLAGCTHFLAELMHRSGADRSHLLLRREIEDASNSVLVPYALSRLEATLSVDADATSDASIPDRTLLLGRVRVGGATLMWHGILHIRVDTSTPSLRVTMSELDIKGVRQIADENAAVALMVSLHKKHAIDDAFELITDDGGLSFRSVANLGGAPTGIEPSRG